MLHNSYSDEYFYLIRAEFKVNLINHENIIFYLFFNSLSFW